MYKKSYMIVSLSLFFEQVNVLTLTLQDKIFSVTPTAQL